MNTVFCVIGKSSSGKDSLAKSLAKKCGLIFMVPCTTRPMRPGESDGKECFFLSEKEYGSEDIICDTKFDSIHGVWSYGYKRMTKNELNIETPYIAVVSPKQFNMMEDEYKGVVNLIGLYIDADEEERMVHAILRERQKTSPDYDELCRRFLADAADFNYNNPEMKKMKQHVHIVTNDFKMTIDEIADEVIYTFRNIIERNN